MRRRDLFQSPPPLRGGVRGGGRQARSKATTLPTLPLQACTRARASAARVGGGNRSSIRRRIFLTSLAATTAAWPLAARAQQTMPVIGLLTARAPGEAPQIMSAFREGLKGIGFVEGQNVTIEYRYGANRDERLPALAAELVQRQVTVIAAHSTPAAIAAKRATSTVPVVFEMGADPIQLGLVASLSRPGGNVTGVTQLVQETEPKRLEVLHELLPSVRVIAFLINATDSDLAGANTRAAQAAADSLGLEAHFLQASSERDFDGVFAKMAELHAGALVIGGEVLFTTHSEQLAKLALHNRVPAFYKGREFAAAGGLVAYGSDITDAYRIAGGYTGRVLKGEKPADLPIQQATKIELIINLKTAKALGINVSLPLSGRADEVIE